jgi:TRAP-type mannitol/chloroaromatic compound transport system permease small subunit
VDVDPREVLVLQPKKFTPMPGLLALARLIDALNERVGRIAIWLILLCTAISAGNAVARYGFNLSSNAFLEIQWYLYTLVFLGAAGYTLKANAHVRIDLVSGRLNPRTRAWIDVFGTLFMLLPVCIIICWFGWNDAMQSYRIGEISADAGGLPRWPIKFVIPFAFALLILQGIAELIKQLAHLLGHAPALDNASPAEPRG